NSGAFTIKDRFTAERSGTTITGDRATGNSKQRTFEAVGHVVVHQTAPLHGTSNEQNLSERPSTLYCDKLDVDGPRQIYSAYGNVHFVQEGGREATADQGTLNDKAHQLHMQGNVQIRDGERTLDAGLVDYNTLTGDLQAQSNVTITAPVATPTPGPPRPTPTPKVRRHR
ncbi:MAG: LptA/OstA family protein, partial [Vulcanimicrobiaceae bacterium]